jgi:hypothetical protein
MGRSGAAVAGVGTSSGRCRNGQRAVAVAEVWVPLTCMGFLCDSKEGLNVGSHNINNAKL